MNKWIAEFELEDGDTMPEHMDLEYKGAKIDFHCRPMWIPCSERRPDRPKRNPVFEDKAVELYLVCNKGDIPTLAFWNGKTFTDGWGRLEVDAWMPLPESYRG